MKVDYSNSTQWNNWKKIQQLIRLKRTLKKTRNLINSKNVSIKQKKKEKKNTKIQRTLFPRHSLR